MSEVIAMGIVSFKDTAEQDENRLNSVLYPPKNSEVSVVLLLSPPVCQGKIPVFIPPPLVYIQNLKNVASGLLNHILDFG